MSAGGEPLSAVGFMLFQSSRDGTAVNATVVWLVATLLTHGALCPLCIEYLTRDCSGVVAAQCHVEVRHRGQGSQADQVTVLMPPEDSRLLTRELFYTAVTRAKRKVRVVRSEAEVRAPRSVTGRSAPPDSASGYS